MLKRAFLLTIVNLLLVTATTQAEPEDLIFHDLSLAGYRIGMTYEEATTVRPFHAVGNLETSVEGKAFYSATIDTIYVDEVEMALTVDFVDDKIQKVVCRFHPSAFTDMLRRFRNALGDGIDKSRVISNNNGGEFFQVIYRWDFPNAKLHLVGLPSNSEFAVVGLVAKSMEKTGSLQAESKE